MRIVIALTVVASVVFASSARSQGCQSPALYFGNGVQNNWPMARSNADELQLTLEAATGNAATVDLAYNQTAGIGPFGLVGDLRESFEQVAISDPALIFDDATFWALYFQTNSPSQPLASAFRAALLSWVNQLDEAAILANVDLTNHAAKYIATISAGQPVVLVAHSQGNLFGNLVYDSLFSSGERSRFWMVSVATPDSRVAGSGPWTTLTSDAVVGRIRALKEAAGATPPLPALTVNLGTHSVSYAAHSFSMSYLAPGSASQQEIASNVLDAISQACSQQRGIEMPVDLDIEDISADGSTVVGTIPTIFGQFFSQEAYRWNRQGGGARIGIFPSGNPTSSGQAVSLDGNVVVGYSRADASLNDPGGFPAAFRWTPQGGMERFDSFSSIVGTAWASDVSADGGTIVGTWMDAPGGRSGFRWSASRGVELIVPPLQVLATPRRVSSDGSVVAGFATIGVSNFAFVWTASGGMSLIPETCSTFPLSSVLLAADSTEFDPDSVVLVTRCASVWRRATGLAPIAGGAFRWATAISHDGSVIMGQGSQGSLVWDAAHGTRVLEDVLVLNRVDLSLLRGDAAAFPLMTDDARTLVFPGRLSHGPVVVDVPATAW